MHKDSCNSSNSCNNNIFKSQPKILDTKKNQIQIKRTKLSKALRENLSRRKNANINPN